LLCPLIKGKKNNYRIDSNIILNARNIVKEKTAYQLLFGRKMVHQYQKAYSLML